MAETEFCLWTSLRRTFVLIVLCFFKESFYVAGIKSLLSLEALYKDLVIIHNLSFFGSHLIAERFLMPEESETLVSSLLLMINGK